jgi:hypothetical protein
MKAFTFAPSSSLLQLGFIAAALVWQVVPVVSAPISSPIPSDAYYCGTDWSDATTNCHHHCPDGTDGECAPGQSCFADTSCNNFLPSPVTQPPSSIPLTLPTPIPLSVSAGGDSRMVAFLGNWQSCPSPDQYDQYTHILISFAVSYIWNAAKNQCSASCTIGAPVPICENQENPELMNVWHAAGKKVILSFGGAGMVSIMQDVASLFDNILLFLIVFLMRSVFCVFFIV